MNPTTGLRLTRLVTFMACLVLAATSGNAAPVPPITPFPDPNVIEFITSGPASFDPTTHVFSYSGPIAAVQFPGEVLSFTDPLVLLGMVTETGIFTGNAISPFSSLDTTGMLLNLTLTITVGGQVVLSQMDRPLSFFGIYTTPSGDHTARWTGLAVPGSLFVDNSTLNSPWLAQFPLFPFDNPGVDATYTYEDKDGLVRNDSGWGGPAEPGTIALFGSGVVLGLARVLRHKLSL